MTESNGKRRLGKPFHMLTLQDVKKDRLEGLLTAKGAIFYTIGASHKPGTPIRVNPQQLATQLSISRAGVYKAIAQLKTEGRIDFEVEGTLIIRIPIDKTTGLAEYLSFDELSTKVDSQSTKVDDLSTKVDSQSTKVDDLSTKVDSQSTKVDDLSTKVDSKPSKPAPGSSSSALSDIQILQISRYKEREIAREEEEKGDLEYRNWLLNRANLLPQKPALLEQWIDKEMLKAANKREFAQYQATRVATPIPAILPQENLSPQDYWAAVEARRNGNG